MPAAETYAGIDQPDNAAVSAGGEHFRCTTWRNRARNTIEAQVTIDQADGQESIVWAGVVRDVANDGTGNGDLPRVLALSAGVFVLHWLESDEGNSVEIHRATFDTQQMANGWVYRSYLATARNQWPLYNHAPVRDDVVDEFVVVWLYPSTDPPAAPASLTIARFTAPYNWGDTVWVTGTGEEIENRVLEIAADDDADGTVVVVAQLGLELQMYTLRASDGSYNGDGEISTGHADSEYSSVGIQQYPGSSDVAVVAEYCLDSDQSAGVVPFNAYHRGLLYRDVTVGTITPATSVQACPNLHLCSRPWMKRNGFDGEYEVFVLASFKTLNPTFEWDQSYGFVLRLNHHDWGGSVPAYSLYPIPCAVLNNGTFDGRAGGYSPVTDQRLVGYIVNKRSNHLSSVALAPGFTQGPDVRTVTLAALFFEQTIASQADYGEGGRDRIQAAVKCVRFYHEEPWTLRADADQPALPAALNFRGFSPYSVGRSVETEAGLIFAGGCMSQYDGLQIVETGFLWAPEIVRIGRTSFGGGDRNIAEGTYYVVATYTWVDRRGTLHRSGPSRVRSVIADADYDQLEYYVRPVNLTMKGDRHHYPTASPVLIELWRTPLVDGAAEGAGVGALSFHRVFSGVTQTYADTPTNDPLLFEVGPIIDEAPNAELQASDLLPWQLDTETLQWNLSIPTPTRSARAMSKWKNRLFSVSHEDPRVIQYTDEFLPIGSQTGAPEHFDANTFRFDSRGDIVGSHAMDDGVVLFTRDGVFALTGEGADAAGAGSTLFLQVITEGTGCVEEGSIVYTPMGIVFQAAKGPYLVNKELQMDHATAGAAISERVRTYGNFRRGTLLEDRHIVRYVVNMQPLAGVERPRLLDFNYELKTWSEHPMPPIVAGSTRLNALQSGAAWRGRQGQVCHVVLAQGGLLVERADDDPVFGDEQYGGTLIPIPLDVQTEWFHFAGLAGLGRVPKIGVTTERVNPGAMAIDVYYDVDGTFDESAPGDTFSWPSPAPAYLPFKPRIPKCTAMMLRIYESGVVPSTENVRIVSITMEFARKTKTRRVNSGTQGV